MNRAPQIVLIFTFMFSCWLGMQIIHELGHVIGALLTGAEIDRVHLHPLKLSRTELITDPHPLAVAWMGPLAGAFIPFIIYIIARLSKSPGLYLFRFFSGFCFIANGTYVALGLNQRSLDPAIMLNNGTPLWVLIGFVLLTIPPGFLLWHGQGGYFGLGTRHGKVDNSAVVVSVFILAALVLVEIVWMK